MPFEDLPTIEYPSDGCWRVARSASFLSFSEINPRTFLLPDAGNRYDVLGAGVLYASTDLEACYAETLARYRPTPAIRSTILAPDPAWESEEAKFMPVGAVARAWRLNRSKARVVCQDPLPFLDVTDHECIDGLNRALGAALEELGLDIPLDISVVQGANRRVTRAIATWAFDQVDEDGDPIYGGVKYNSRLGDWSNWAIFEGAEVEHEDLQSIPAPASEPALLAIERRFDIRVH